MKNFRMILKTLLVSTLIFSYSVFSQDDEGGISYKIKPYDGNIFLSGGISYDILSTPTDKSFDYPLGKMTFNVPLNLPYSGIDIADQIDGVLDSSFSPELALKQNLNFSVNIDVPMLRGVCSFGITENCNLGFGMNLGTYLSVDDSLELGEGLSAQMVLNGAINAPISYTMGWRSMSFGYAYKVDKKDITFAFNLHRHLFELQANGLVGININGNINVYGMDIPLSYDEKQTYGHLSSSYTGGGWSPSFGLQFWRITATARMGVQVSVPGEYKLTREVPFFLDPATMQVDEDELVIMRDDFDVYFEDSLFEAMKDIDELRSRLQASETVKKTIETTEPFKFSIPAGYSLVFDIVRDAWTIQYSYVDGAISGFQQETNEFVNLDIGLQFNHIITTNIKTRNFSMDLGVFTMDFQDASVENKYPGVDSTSNEAYADRDNLLSWALGEAYPKLSGDPIFPIFNIGARFGGDIQMILNLDLLPIPALKTGVYYYF